MRKTSRIQQLTQVRQIANFCWNLSTKPIVIQQQFLQSNKITKLCSYLTSKEIAIETHCSCEVGPVSIEPILRLAQRTWKPQI